MHMHDQACQSCVPVSLSLQVQIPKGLARQLRLERVTFLLPSGIFNSHCIMGSISLHEHLVTTTNSHLEAFSATIALRPSALASDVIVLYNGSTIIISNSANLARQAATAEQQLQSITDTSCI